MLHQFLGIGLVTLTTLALVAKYFGVVPLLPPDGVTAKIAHVISFISVALIGHAVGVLRPRALLEVWAGVVGETVIEKLSARALLIM